MVIQFYVGGQLFDWFFNARTGYRAHFRADARAGIAFNNKLVELIREHAETTLQYPISGRKLVGEFEDGGEAKLEKGFLLDSLLPTLAKAWMCNRRIGARGGIVVLAPGLTGPRLDVGDSNPWVAPYRDDDGCWLDIYGAFLGKSGPYQPKDPMRRAEKLHLDGQA